MQPATSHSSLAFLIPNFYFRLSVCGVDAYLAKHWPESPFSNAKFGCYRLTVRISRFDLAPTALTLCLVAYACAAESAEA